MAPDAKIEWHQRHPDSHYPFFVRRLSWPWFSAEIDRIKPTELGYRVRGDAAYLALHDFVRSDGETTINGGGRSTLTDVRGKLTFAPIGSSVEGWNCFKGRVSSVFAVHLIRASELGRIKPVSLCSGVQELRGALALSVRSLRAGPRCKRAVVEPQSIDCRRGARGGV